MSNPENQTQTARGVLRIIIGGSATALYVGLAAWAYSAALADDMTTASITLFLAWLIGVCALSLSEILGAFTPRKRIRLNILFGILLAILSVALWRYFYTKRPAPAPPVLTVASFLQYEAALQRDLQKYNGPSTPLFHVRLNVSVDTTPPITKESIGILNVVTNMENHYLITPINYLINFGIENMTDKPQLIVGYSVEDGYSEHGPWTPYCNVYTIGGSLQMALSATEYYRTDSDTLLENTLLSKPIAPHKTVYGWAALQCPNTNGCDWAFLRFKMKSAGGSIYSQTLNKNKPEGGGPGANLPGGLLGHTDLTSLPIVVRNDCVQVR